jgi:prevent-host-death family protein
MPFQAQDVVSLSQARAHLSELADQVNAGAEKILTKNGESYVALVDARRLDYFHALERERIHLLVLDDAIKGLEDVEHGRVRDARKALSRRKVQIAAHFEANLASIAEYLEENDAPSAFDALLVRIEDDVVPNLESFPDIGRTLLDRTAGSVEALRSQKRLSKKLGTRTIREYLTGDYLILYLDDGSTITLLSIRHHRQLSYDLEGIWG